MTAEPSPRPWKVDDSAAHERFGRKFVRIRDANGQSLTVEGKGRLFAEDAALIVDAVNLHEYLIEHNKLNAEKVVELMEERDRLRDLVRRFADYAETYHALGVKGKSLVAEARAAIGEDGE